MYILLTAGGYPRLKEQCQKIATLDRGDNVSSAYLNIFLK